jgi:hypothetical protein
MSEIRHPGGAVTGAPRHQRDCGLQIAKRQLGAHADDAEAQATEIEIAANVGPGLTRKGTIRFNDKPTPVCRSPDIPWK